MIKGLIGIRSLEELPKRCTKGVNANQWGVAERKGIVIIGTGRGKKNQSPLYN